MPLLLLQSDPTNWSVLPNKTSIGINASGQLCLKQPNGSVTILTSQSPGSVAAVNAAGNTLVVPTQQIFTAVVTVSGAARTVPIALGFAGMTQGAILELLVILPTTAGLALDIRNGTVGGTQLDTYTSNGGTVSAKWKFLFDGAAWQKTEAIIPAY